MKVSKRTASIVRLFAFLYRTEHLDDVLAAADLVSLFDRKDGVVAYTFIRRATGGAS